MLPTAAFAACGKSDACKTGKDAACTKNTGALATVVHTRPYLALHHFAIRSCIESVVERHHRQVVQHPPLLQDAGGYFGDWLHPRRALHQRLHRHLHKPDLFQAGSAQAGLTAAVHVPPSDTRVSLHTSHRTCNGRVLSACPNSDSQRGPGDLIDNIKG